jgi:polynucleotide 5'-kinase involved in rRNA processing
MDRAPFASIFCGNIQPADNPMYYLNAIKSLIKIYQTHEFFQANKIPLVVNTHGWVKSKAEMALF